MSSAKKWGGEPHQYYKVHAWFDCTKEHFADPRHRALRHHSQGIGWAIEHFGPTIEVSTDRCAGCYEKRPVDPNPCPHCQETVLLVMKKIPVRWIGERHCLEDFGRIPTVADWLRCMTTETWMVKGARPLSRELETTPVSSLETANEKETQHV